MRWGVTRQRVVAMQTCRASRLCVVDWTWCVVRGAGGNERADESQVCGKSAVEPAAFGGEVRWAGLGTTGAGLGGGGGAARSFPQSSGLSRLGKRHWQLAVRRAFWGARLGGYWEGRLWRAGKGRSPVREREARGEKKKTGKAEGA